MKKPSISCLILVLVLCLAASESMLASPPFVGVFKNKGGAAWPMLLIFNDDGKGIVGPGRFLWKTGAAKNQITLTGSFSGNPQKSDSVTVMFDPEKKEIKFLDDKLNHGESLFHGETFYFTTNQIPKGLHNQLLHFDGTDWSMTHGCTDTILAFGVTNHLGDLRRLEQAIRDEGLYCRFNMGIAGDPINLLAVDVRDVDLARDYSKKVINQASLSVKIRKSEKNTIFEVWRDGKKVGEERFENGKPIPTWVRP